jgi:hypothetical protein
VVKGEFRCWAKAEFADTMNMEELGDLPLSGEDMQDIVAFLNTLTDGYVVPGSEIPEPSSWAMLLRGCWARACCGGRAGKAEPRRGAVIYGP